MDELTRGLKVVLRLMQNRQAEENDPDLLAASNYLEHAIRHTTLYIERFEGAGEEKNE
jgi:hypothetical protein